MGKILECGGSKAFKNLEQCHEIQGEFKRSPIYYLKTPNNLGDNYEEMKRNNLKSNFFEQQINEEDNELNVIIYNSDEFCHDISNNNINKDKQNLIKNEKENYISRVVDSIKLKKAKLNKSFQNNKNKENKKNFGKVNNLMDDKINKGKEDENRIKKKLIYNNSEGNINKNKDKNIKKDINEHTIEDNDFKIKNNKNNINHNNKIVKNIYMNKNNKQINYLYYNDVNHNIILHNKEKKVLKNKGKENVFIKRKKKSNKEQKKIKRNKSYQIMSSFPKSVNITSSKLKNSIKYKFTPKIKSNFPLNITDNNSGNSSKRQTNLTSGINSPKFINDKYFKRSEEDIFNKNNNINDKYNNTSNNNNSKYNLYKFIPFNKKEKQSNLFIDLEKNNELKTEPENNLFDIVLNINRRHHSNERINNYKIDQDENKIDKESNKNIIKVKIPFKGTQINRNLLNNSVNNMFILNYNMISKISEKAVLYDGNIFKVTNHEKSKLVLRYFQITKKYFRYYNNIHSLVLPNVKPLEYFEIKNIKKIEIIDVDLLKNKNEYNIKFAFIINLKENINFFIFATNDKDLGMNIINILNLIKKYFDEERDLFK